jgi:hypothetical protein
LRAIAAASLFAFLPALAVAELTPHDLVGTRWTATLTSTAASAPNATFLAVLTSCKRERSGVTAGSIVCRGRFSHCTGPLARRGFPGMPCPAHRGLFDRSRFVADDSVTHIDTLAFATFHGRFQCFLIVASGEDLGPFTGSYNCNELGHDTHEPDDFFTYDYGTFELMHR